MTPAIVSALLLLGSSQGAYKASMLSPLEGEESRTSVYQNLERLSEPKISPLHKWEFDWIVTGYARADDNTESQTYRLRVFSQERRSVNDKAPMIARMGMRLWELNKLHLGLDNPVRANKVIDLYLCWGGKAGGEQKFDEDVEGGRARIVNTIYIYDLASFDGPVEMAREVAHEYGHATLPPVGGFETPEDWSNGYLGEKLFLRWARDLMADKKAGPQDFMNVEFEDLDAWVKQNVDPLTHNAATQPPDIELLGSKGQKAMDAYLGLVLYAQELLPQDLFMKTFAYLGGMSGDQASAKDYPAAITAVIKDYPECVFNVPETLKGKAIWLPISTEDVSGAKVLDRKGAWSKVQPTSTSISIQKQTNPDKTDPNH